MILPISTITAITCASACQPSVIDQAQVEIHQHKKLTPKIESKVESKIETIPQPILPTKLHQIRHQDITFNLVTFDTRSHHLIIADQPNGPGTTWTDAAAAATDHQGIAAINAGFFTPEGNPLGIVISQGEKRGSFNTSSLGSGLFYQTSNRAAISRSAAWTALSKNPPDHLLQSGPMLLEHAKPITGLSTIDPRPRSFIATDGNNHWCIGHSDSCTLAQLSDALTSLKTPEFSPTTALNLDGGRSSDLWVSASINGKSMQLRPFWNKPVRNFLILKSNE